MLWIGIICTLVMFTCIVVIHEWGHFKAARLFGVKVEEFGIGIPPRMKKLFTDKKGTLFSLNWIPFGGFVRLKGESESEFNIYSKKRIPLSQDQIKLYIRNDTALFFADGRELGEEDRVKIVDIIRHNSQNDNLYKKPYWQQSIIILAGVTMNFFLAWILFSGLFIFGVQPLGINTVLKTNVHSLLIPTYEQSLSRGILEKKEGIMVSPVVNSLAMSGGLLQGDIVLKIDGQIVSSVDQFRNILQTLAGKQVLFDIRRGNLSKNLTITLGNDGKIGAYIGENISYNKNFIYKMSFFDAFLNGGKEVYAQSILTLEGLKYIFSRIFFPVEPGERQEAIKSMSGPIGITKIITDGLSLGVHFLIIIAALISVNLAVFNLLPIPALDGGRFLFILIHSFFGLFSKNKIISSHLENIVHVFFFLILIIMSILIAYNDIYKLFQ